MLNMVYIYHLKTHVQAAVLCGQLRTNESVVGKGGGGLLCSYTAVTWFVGWTRAKERRELTH